MQEQDRLSEQHASFSTKPVLFADTLWREESRAHLTSLLCEKTPATL